MQLNRHASLVLQILLLFGNCYGIERFFFTYTRHIELISMLKSVTVHLIRVHSHSQSCSLFSICAAEASTSGLHLKGPACEKEAGGLTRTQGHQPENSHGARGWLFSTILTEKSISHLQRMKQTSKGVKQNTDFSLNVLNKELHSKQLLKAKQTL